MNASETLKIGDVVYFNYGAMCGEEFGTVLGFEHTQFGTLAWVRKSDFHTEGLLDIAGDVAGSYYVDSNGEPHMVARGSSRIGAYKVTFAA